MRFMLLLKGDPRVDATEGVAADAVEGPMPPAELINGMLAYLEDLTKAGVLLAAEGLFDSSRGARVVYAKELALFDEVYRAEGRDLRATIARVIRLAKSKQDDPFGAIRAFLATFSAESPP